MTKKKINPFLIAILALIIAMAAYLFYTFQNEGSKLAILRKAPDFTLQELNGDRYNLRENTGKVMLIEFMFTNCPDICPATTYNMTLLQNDLINQGSFGDNVQFVSITFDPATDTPEVFAEYADRMGVDRSGWKLLRGEEGYTLDLTQEYGVSVQKLGDNQFVHTTTSLMLLDANQQIRNIYRMGADMDNAVILKDINTLIQEQ